GTDCNGIRALVLAIGNTDPIPNGAVLYTCSISIAADALPGDHPVEMIRPIVSSPQGMSLPVTGTNGKILVTGGSADTPTPTAATTRPPTDTPGPNDTPTPTAATTLPPTDTPGPNDTPTPTAPGTRRPTDTPAPAST